MAQQLTANLKGQHKALSDIVENISPESTPFLSMIVKSTIDNVLFYWTEEELAAAGSNSAKEGADAKDHVDNVLIEHDNYTQIFTKTVRLSGSAMVTSIAGQKQKLAHQVELRAKELKRDQEFAFLSGQVKTGETASVGRLTASYQAQVDAGNVIDQASAVITLDVIDELLTRLFENGATPDYIMCHPRVRNALVKAISQRDGVLRDVGNGTEIVNDVVRYTSPVGAVDIINNRLAKYDASTGIGDIYVFDSSMWELVTLRPYSLNELAKTGDSEARQLIVECGLKNRSFKSAGLITNVKV
ncbi:TPA: SU10 major capsid protein [Klebsiella pneumoniae]|uniref:SU10 major capsid protein n=1 Tax=Klebsiella pneumoniae TaxID=573 RepID=UPI000B9AD139|nr:DUF5309 family protein [Klebsiella pneumoniae]AWA69297.1 hypothetical protein B7D49_19850 [Klebsiella pneumoniae]MCB3011210.1 DUF5309 family protein [Klebsiella pneumoniae]MCB3212088.1 DUF5309 family protein [Klebsiella pneumoniae]MCB3223826.1 DUF5309 family protein [Klebsiella pneumoniae]MCB3226919.1 DUF5309 family protein [Klebsiella pneumoniae]